MPRRGECFTDESKGALLPEHSRPAPVSPSCDRSAGFGPLPLFAVLSVAMFTGVFNDYLFSYDESRVAEISRATLMEGHWITPHLCGLPFLEKPPLYYDVTALAFMASGRVSPPVARTVSVLFGLVMLAGVFWFVERSHGRRAAWLATFVLVSTVRFWIYSHEVSTDIGMGAFATLALAAFAIGEFVEGDPKRRDSLTTLCAVFLAGAFLTKSVLAIFTPLSVMLAFALLTRRWETLRRFLRPLPMLAFFGPVVAWVTLYYQDGGLPYVHVHFVNNTIGRALHTQFELEGAQFHHTDVGREQPWYYYIANAPNIFGVWSIALVFAVGWAWRQIRRSSTNHERSELVFVLLWALLPIALLSIPSSKARSYIIPSYAGVAILVGLWLDSLLTRPDALSWRRAIWFVSIIPFALYSYLFDSIDPGLFLGVGLAALLPLLGVMVWRFWQRRMTEGVYLSLSLMCCLLIVTCSSNVNYLRRGSKELSHYARAVWKHAGERPVYLFKPNDVMRGSIPFRGMRPVRELDTIEELSGILDEESFLIVLSEKTGQVLRATAPDLISRVRELGDDSLPNGGRWQLVTFEGPIAVAARD